jgi:hypothetical protein
MQALTFIGSAILVLEIVASESCLALSKTPK